MWLEYQGYTEDTIEKIKKEFFVFEVKPIMEMAHIYYPKDRCDAMKSCMKEIATLLNNKGINAKLREENEQCHYEDAYPVFHLDIDEGIVLELRNGFNGVVGGFYFSLYLFPNLEWSGIGYMEPFTEYYKWHDIVTRLEFNLEYLDAFWVQNGSIKEIYIQIFNLPLHQFSKL